MEESTILIAGVTLQFGRVQRGCSPLKGCIPVAGANARLYPYLQSRSASITNVSLALTRYFTTRSPSTTACTSFT